MAIKGRRRERGYIGSFEELVLLCIVGMNGESYGQKIANKIEERGGPLVAGGAINNTLQRLREKEMLQSRVVGATAETNYRNVVMWKVTDEGCKALVRAERFRKLVLDGGVIPDV